MKSDKKRFRFSTAKRYSCLIRYYFTRADKFVVIVENW